MALRNFMARRGVPKRIFSDRGTNFTASSKELGAALKEMNQDQVIQEIVSPHTEWEFLPPASPHMGGSWERLVRQKISSKAQQNIIKDDKQPAKPIYIYKVLKQITGVSLKAMGIMNSNVNGILECIAARESRLDALQQALNDQQPRDTTVRPLLPGELAKHVVSEGTKAANKHTSSK
ncbi:histone H2B-like [Armigeres subalbatus]|uniref:histone H2B-like n=1 Tax=Armigeres subalbatus TaxID=124917 RepID=UPI002ED6317F